MIMTQFLPENQIKTEQLDHGQTIEDSTVLSGSFNPLHIGHLKLAKVAHDVHKPANGIIFEITLNNADKGALDDISSITKRVLQFQPPNSIDMGINFSVVLTRAPLFIDKSHMFPNSVFTIGWDTYVRLLNPKYYECSQKKLISALHDFAINRTKFVVGGRLVSGIYQNKHENLIPDGFEGMFTFLSEPKFRTDISSTELREREKDKR